MAWNIDKSHTEVGFAVRHMMISTVRGTFTRYDADISIDPANLEAAKVIARIEAGSIDTKEEKRDGHLRSPDFLDTEKYPTLTFTSTKVTRSGGDVEVTGNLKIKDQEHPVTLKGELVGPSKDPWGNVRVGFSLGGDIDREQFGLTWNQALEAGGVLIAKKVKLVLEAQLVQS